MNSFFARKFVIQALFIAVAVVLLARLFYIQILDKDYYLSANYNAIRPLKIYPSRGIILDRNNKILVQNEPVYDIMVIPKDVKPFDTLEFCSLIGIDKAGFDRRFKKARNYSPYRASIFEKQLSAKTYASLQEKLYQFPGFFEQKRTVRSYPDSIASHFLGYIGEVTDNMIDRYGPYYSPGDYIGISGVEKYYEPELRGVRGVQKIMVDALNRTKGSYSDGTYDTLAIAGANLVSSLDKNLQKLGEQLLRNKKGSIVAIEPSTGEILAYVSSPGYDPNSMVGRERGNNYMKMLNDPSQPMFNRPIQAEYPPGSIFKVVNILIAQQFGSIDSTYKYNCPGGYRYGRSGFMACTHVHGSLNLVQSIQYSCNTFLGFTYNRMIDHAGIRPVNAFKKWREAVAQFGIGSKLDLDLPNERSGKLPSDELYTGRFGNDKWGSSYTISLSIGQGELGITPLQMANVMAIVANRGFYYKPHLVKAIGDKNIVKEEYTEKNSVDIKSRYFDLVIEGMSRAVNQPGGTAYSTNSRIPGIEMCGKTGTVQNPHGADHSVFVAFAPRVNPKIAIAVVVENAGYGSVWSAPMASLMVEKYLTDSITKPKYYIDRLLNTSFIGGKMILNSPTPIKKDTSNQKPPAAQKSTKATPIPKQQILVAKPRNESAA